MGDEFQDLNILEMIHELELRAYKVFTVTETHRELLQKVSLEPLRDMGLTPAPRRPQQSGPLTQSRFLDHFSWVQMPPTVVQFLHEHATGATIPTRTPLSSTRLDTQSFLHPVADFKSSCQRRADGFTRGAARLVLKRLCGLGGSESSYAYDSLLLGGSANGMAGVNDYWSNGISHFLCLRRQEDYIQGVASNMRSAEHSVRDKASNQRVSRKLTRALFPCEEANDTCAGPNGNSGHKLSSESMHGAALPLTRKVRESSRKCYTLGSQRVALLAASCAPASPAPADALEAQVGGGSPPAVTV